MVNHGGDGLCVDADVSNVAWKGKWCSTKVNSLWRDLAAVVAARVAAINKAAGHFTAWQLPVLSGGSRAHRMNSATRIRQW